MRLFLVGGSWRAIARIDMDRRELAAHGAARVPHDARRRVRDHAQFIGASDVMALRGKLGISEDRMALVPVTVQVLDELVRVFKPKDIADLAPTASARGCSTSGCPRRCASGTRCWRPAGSRSGGTRGCRASATRCSQLRPAAVPAGRLAAAAHHRGGLPAARRDLAGAPGLPRRDLLRQRRRAPTSAASSTRSGSTWGWRSSTATPRAARGDAVRALFKLLSDADAQEARGAGAGDAARRDALARRARRAGGLPLAAREEDAGAEARGPRAAALRRGRAGTARGAGPGHGGRDQGRSSRTRGVIGSPRRSRRAPDLLRTRSPEKG